LSREAFPKQFHRILGPETLFQTTCHRLTGDLFGHLSVLSNSRHRFLVAEQLAETGKHGVNIILEPEGRNTAPAACMSALIASRSDPNTIVLLAPSDHVITDADGFAAAVRTALAPARDGALVTFGVEPDCPHTGYGYIETSPSNGDVLPVTRFVEKPSYKVAETYLDAGGFYWNAGIFMYRPVTLIKLFEEHAPDVLAACQRALDSAVNDLDFLVLGEAYGDAPAISLDYAVAEKADNLACVPLMTPWSDVGSWSAVWDFTNKDESGNVVKGDGRIVVAGSSNSFAYSDHACVALVGVENLVVVAMEDAVLVMSREHTESIKAVVDDLKGTGQDLTLHHNRVYRPWGWYQSLNRGDRYQVKCIMVKPGGKLSLQSHHHRSEHWVVVRGTVEVTKGDAMELLSENESTYIPIGKKHRLANPGKIPALLIEVQSGAYLDEDDIIRFEDSYRRSANE
jgi:mannose-1-phosphate guanylyltransferase/mannose-6-phosphate isomerase